jgi:serine phosphatase RsbU (regulator of sigma subunit)/transcriptional regulator with GAF, ATPase, and Fis domain
MSESMLPKSRLGESIFLPPDARRLLIGLAVAIAGPVVISPITIRMDAFSRFPGLPFLLVVVIATLFGRLLAAGISTFLSVLLLDRYFLAPLTGYGARTGSDLWAIGIFILVATVVAQLVVRLDRAVRAEVREHDRLAFLANAGDAISGSLDVDATLKQLADVLVPALADWFSVELREGDAISNALVVHRDPEKVELARRLQQDMPPDPEAATGPGRVIRTGESELTETISDEMLSSAVHDPQLLATMRGLGLRCAMVVPLTARDRTFGAITLIGAETHERYGPNDLRLAEEIADRAALAIDTARLFAAESEARADAMAESHRNEILKDVTAAFGLALTVEDVMKAMLDKGIRMAGAVAGTVGLLIDEGEVRLVGMSGYEPDDHPYWHSFDVSEQLPLADAIRDRAPLVLSTTEERDERYPLLKGRGEQRDHVLVCLPLLLGDEPIGGFSASYPPDSEFGDDDLAFLRALGEQCAQAIDRARSVERERVTRARFDALASASRALARTLDYDETAITVVRLALQHLGGRAMLLARDGAEVSVLAEGDDAGARTVLGEPLDREEVPPGVEAAIEAGLEEGRARFVPGDPGRPWPDLVLPLSIAGSTFGALVVREPRHDYRNKQDFEFAREIARRMARAIENARLYRDRDYVARTLQQSLLPPKLPEVPGVDIESLFLPAMRGYEVGGDFYDVFQTPSGRWAAVIGDVCGKGVDAAALTGLARHTLRAIADVDRPSEALAALNAALLRESIDGRFCTVAYVLIEPQPGGGARLSLASGGHPLPQRISTNGDMERVGEHGTLLGVTPEPRLVDVDIELLPGETLIAFTDGILRKHEALGDVPEELIETLRSEPLASAAVVRERIQRYVHDVISSGQDDDIAVLVLRAR